MRQVAWMVVWGLLVGPVWGLEAARLQFFDCGTVRFFGEGCVPEPRAPREAPPAVTSTPPPTVPATPPAPLSAADSPSASPPDALFTPETMAPGTPPLLLRVLEEPTDANAQAFLDWQRARLARIVEVQALLQRLGQARGTASREAGDVPDGGGGAAGIPPATGRATVRPTCPAPSGVGVRSACALRQP